MKILLINNNTEHLKALSKALAAHDVEVQKYKPGLEFHLLGKDMVILSGGGGEGFEIDDQHSHGELWYKDEMDFIRSCQLPTIGICMGFEIMAKAHGQEVPKLSKLVYDFQPVSITKEGWELFPRLQLKQFEAHSWHIPEVPKGFDILANSENGVEMMYNPELKQLGTQFHPEEGGSLNLEHLIKSLAAA